MKEKNNNINIISPVNQLNLIGFDEQFNYFVKLFKINKLPNTIMLSGKKGSGKSTLAYHLINYILSLNEDYSYDLNNFTINTNNSSYKKLCDNMHPNFFLLESNISDGEIKIEKTRNLLSFLNKSTYLSNIKIVLIDSVEYLNLSSSNALLKALEDTKYNTFFLIIHNNENKILETINSRCIRFRISLTSNTKRKILKKIFEQYNLNFDLEEVINNFYFDTPGNILNYLKVFTTNNIFSTNNRLECISTLISEFKVNKSKYLLYCISVMIELFYNELALRQKMNLNIYSYNKLKILKQINNFKKYNLDINNLFISIHNTIYNER